MNLKNHLNSRRIPQLTLQHLACIRALKQLETVTEAAQELGVSQPAVSQALSEIERRLGVGLFDRRGRRLHLNQAGWHIARFADDVLGQAEALELWLNEFRAGRSGILRVGMIDAVSLYVLPTALRAFRMKRPDVELRLTVERSGLLLDQLRRRELDLTFVVAPVAAEFEAIEILREPLYLYGPPEDRDPVTGDWVLFPLGRQTRALIDEGLSRMGIRPRVTLESDSPDVLRQMVALGIGWSVLPAGVAESGTEPITRFSDEPVGVRTIVAVTRANEEPDPRREAFLEFALSSESHDYSFRG